MELQMLRVMEACFRQFAGNLGGCVGGLVHPHVPLKEAQACGRRVTTFVEPDFNTQRGTGIVTAPSGGPST